MHRVRCGTINMINILAGQNILTWVILPEEDNVWELERCSLVIDQTRMS